MQPSVLSRFEPVTVEPTSLVVNVEQIMAEVKY
jgi:hypothetical protein